MYIFFFFLFSYVVTLPQSHILKFLPYLNDFDKYEIWDKIYDYLTFKFAYVEPYVPKSSWFIDFPRWIHWVDFTPFFSFLRLEHNDLGDLYQAIYEELILDYKLPLYYIILGFIVYVILIQNLVILAYVDIVQILSMKEELSILFFVIFVIFAFWVVVLIYFLSKQMSTISIFFRQLFKPLPYRVGELDFLKSWINYWTPKDIFNHLLVYLNLMKDEGQTWFMKRTDQLFFYYLLSIGDFIVNVLFHTVALLGIAFYMFYAWYFDLPKASFWAVALFVIVASIIVSFLRMKFNQQSYDINLYYNNMFNIMPMEDEEEWHMSNQESAEFNYQAAIDFEHCIDQLTYDPYYTCRIDLSRSYYIYSSQPWWYSEPDPLMDGTFLLPGCVYIRPWTSLSLLKNHFDHYPTYGYPSTNEWFDEEFVEAKSMPKRSLEYFTRSLKDWKIIGEYRNFGLRKFKPILGGIRNRPYEVMDFWGYEDWVMVPKYFSPRYYSPKWYVPVRGEGWNYKIKYKYEVFTYAPMAGHAFQSDLGQHRSLRFRTNFNQIFYKVGHPIITRLTTSITQDEWFKAGYPFRMGAAPEYAYNTHITDTYTDVFPDMWIGGEEV